MPFAGGPLYFNQCRLVSRRGAVETLSIVDAERRAPASLLNLQAPRPNIAGLDHPWPLIMGIINVTPDSFHDGGRRLDPNAAIAHGRALASAGAAILDIGGESTRPGAAAVPVAEELARVIPVIEALTAEGLVLSVDTRRAAVMAAAVKAGARMINDVTALRHDPDSLACVAELSVPVVLMHSRGEPATMRSMTRYDDLVMDVFDALAARVAACTDAGIDRGRLLIDPGLGFAKEAAQSAELLRRMASFHALGCPVLIGASRKSFIGNLTGAASPEDRLPGSLAAAFWATQQGAAVLRVHDVTETVQMLAIFRSLCYKELEQTNAR
ncbi:MAG: dihydropteroate synthase [Proteobacteria bacterium]|nr:dihydropteroate synthase [Pseudomonadota bacterium]